MSLAWPLEKKTLKITRIANGRDYFLRGDNDPKKYAKMVSNR